MAPAVTIAATQGKMAPMVCVEVNTKHDTDRDIVACMIGTLGLILGLVVMVALD